MKRAALYIRVSTQEQAQEGYSVGEQKERLIAYCKAQDWLIANIYVDGGFSGSNLNRPAIQQLISETDKFDVVLVYKLDRLSRSQRDTLYLIEEVFLPHNIGFVSMQESFDTTTPLGKAMIGLLAVFAQLEREQIKERTQMGRAARAKSGLFHGGGYVPIGYDYQDGKLVINPYEAEQVRKIFEWYLSGMSLQAITDRLHEEGYVNRYGSYKAWPSVRRIIENDLYTGRVRFGDVRTEHAHEAIITEEQFQAVKEMQARRKEQYGMYSFKSRHLLTGICFCGYCGARYYVRTLRHRHYYACYSRTKQAPRMIKDPNCKNRYWNKKELEAKVEEQIRVVLQSPQIALDAAQAKRPVTPQDSQHNAKIEKRIRAIDRKISKTMELYQRDDIPADVLSENINKLYNEKTALESSLIPTEETPQEASIDLTQELIADAAQLWDFADESQKRRIIQSLVKKITLTGDDIQIEWRF